MIALVTGGTGGLGPAICTRLAGDGHTVAIGCHTRREAAAALAAHLESRGGHAFAMPFDVTDDGAVDDAVGQVAHRAGGLDAVVHAAAWNADGLLANLAPDAIERMHAVNVAGALRVIRAATPWLVTGARGRVVLFSSVLAARAVPGVAGYVATKGAIEALTRSLAVELGPKRVTVNAVAPGFVDAGLGRRPVAAAGEALPSIVPLRRAGTAEDVAAVVAFLVSEAAGYVSGAVVPVDGGLLAGPQTLGMPRARGESLAAARPSAPDPSGGAA
jgi:3-oxoacyl-[acyl-carrier protein] reductase